MEKSTGPDPRELLHLGYALIPLAAGADKFTNLLTHWEQYLDPRIARATRMEPERFMKVVGVIEMAVGALALTKYRKHAAYVTSGWLAAIAGQLIAQGKYLDIAARDVLLSVSAFAYGRLEAQAGEARPRVPERLPEEASRRRTLTPPARVPSNLRSPAVEETSVFH